MATVSDVARRAGVSVSTVSYALSGARPISAATRVRIERAMDELGYTPNALAQGLASRRSRMIALVFPTAGRGLNLSGLEYVMGAADRAQESGYHLLMWTTDDLTELRKLVRQGLVDGVLVMEVCLDDERIKVLAEEKVRFALIGRTGHDEGIDYTDTDFAQTARLAVEHLAGLGHTEIVFLDQPPVKVEAGYGPSARAETGVRRAAEALGLSVEARPCASTRAAGLATFTTLVRRNPRITAAIAMNEEAVVGLMAGAVAHGWRIPDEFSVVSLNSAAGIAEMTTPPLTTCGPPAGEMGRVGVDVLIRRLEGEDTAEASQILFAGSLVVRGTTAAARPVSGRRGRRRVPTDGGSASSASDA